MQYRQQHGMEVHSNSYRLVRWKRFKDHRIAGWRAVGGGAFQWDEAGRFRRHTAHGAGGPAHRGLGRHRLHDRRGRLSFEEGLDIFQILSSVFRRPIFRTTSRRANESMKARTAPPRIQIDPLRAGAPRRTTTIRPAAIGNSSHILW